MNESGSVLCGDVGLNSIECLCWRGVDTGRLDVDEKVDVEGEEDGEEAERELLGHGLGAPDLGERVIRDDEHKPVEWGCCEHPRGELSKEEKREDMQFTDERTGHVVVVLVDEKVTERAKPDNNQIGDRHKRQIEESRVDAQIRPQED